MRLVGVVPAAGRATRLQPLAGSKEVLPVAGRPVMEHVLERMREASPDEIRVVTRRDKTDVAARAAAHGARVILGEPPSSAESALLAIRDLAAYDVVMLGFPDTVWTANDAFPRVLALVAQDADVALGLFTARDEEQLRRSDVVVADGPRVLRIEVKPQQPPSNLLWGCAAARAGVLDRLAGREHPGDAFAELAGEGRVAGVLLEGDFFDVGTPADLAEARP